MDLVVARPDDNEARRAQLTEFYQQKSRSYFKCGTCAATPVKQRIHFYNKSAPTLHIKIDLSETEREA